MKKKKDMTDVFSRLRKDLRSFIALSLKENEASHGAAVFEKSNDLREVLEKADARMYRDKEQNRGKTGFKTYIGS